MREMPERLAMLGSHAQFISPQTDLQETIRACKRETLSKFSGATGNDLPRGSVLQPKTHLGFSFDPRRSTVAGELHISEFVAEPAYQIDRMDADIHERTAARLNWIEVWCGTIPIMSASFLGFDGSNL